MPLPRSPGGDGRPGPFCSAAASQEDHLTDPAPAGRQVSARRKLLSTLCRVVACHRCWPSSRGPWAAGRGGEPPGEPRMALGPLPHLAALLMGAQVGAGADGHAESPASTRGLPAAGARVPPEPAPTCKGAGTGPGLRGRPPHSGSRQASRHGPVPTPRPLQAPGSRVAGGRVADRAPRLSPTLPCTRALGARPSLTPHDSTPHPHPGRC